MENFRKYNFDNVKVQALVLIIPIIYHYFYFFVSDYQNYLDYIKLSWVHKLMSCMYYGIGIGVLLVTIFFIMKTPKGIIRYVDYLIRAIMIGLYAIRFFITDVLYEILSNIPQFLITIDFYTGQISMQDLCIHLATVVSICRLLFKIIKRRKMKAISKND